MSSKNPWKQGPQPDPQRPPSEPEAPTWQGFPVRHDPEVPVGEVRVEPEAPEVDVVERWRELADPDAFNPLEEAGNAIAAALEAERENRNALAELLSKALREKGVLHERLDDAAEARRKDRETVDAGLREIVGCREVTDDCCVNCARIARDLLARDEAHWIKGDGAPRPEGAIEEYVRETKADIKRMEERP